MSAANPVISGGNRLSDYPHYRNMDATLGNAAGALSIDASGSREGSGGQGSHAAPEHYPGLVPAEGMVSSAEIEQGYDAHERLGGGRAV